MKKYHTIRWFLEISGISGEGSRTYSRGYEVFTSRKASNEYAKMLRKNGIQVTQETYLPDDLTHLIHRVSKKPDKTKEGIGNLNTVYNRGFQFH